jgi:hypothetical protein
MAIDRSEDRAKLYPINRLCKQATCQELIPATSINNLVSEEEARLADLECKEFEALGKARDISDEFRVLYRLFYDEALERIASGESRSGILSALAEFVDTDDSLFASAVKEAYCDALAGRPCKV